MEHHLFDAQQFSDLIGVIYDSAFEDEQWGSLIARLTELNPGHVAGVVTFDSHDWVYSGATGVPEDAQGAQIDELRQDLHDGKVAQQHDLYLVLAARQGFSLGDVVCTRDVFTDEEFRGFETYKQTMAPIGAGHYTYTNYSMSEDRRAALMIVENDWDDTPKDTAAVRRLMDLIAPHVIRASRLARALTLAREASETYRGFIDAIALPMVICDSEGRIQMTNSAGQRLLDSGELIAQESGGRLKVTGASRETGALNRLLRETGGDTGPQGMRVHAGDEVVSVCVAPFRASMTLGNDIDKHIFGQQDLFAIFLGASESGPIHAGLLRTVFDLTPREAEVCAALGRGRTPAEIAAGAGRAEKTIRNQVQSVLEKVGVSSTRQLSDALSVFRTVGAMFDGESAGSEKARRLPG